MIQQVIKEISPEDRAEFEIDVRLPLGTKRSREESEESEKLSQKNVSESEPDLNPPKPKKKPIHWTFTAKERWERKGNVRNRANQFFKISFIYLFNTDVKESN